MDLSQIYALISTFALGGGGLALVRWLWQKFEGRMDRGDAIILNRISEMEKDRKEERQTDQEVMRGALGRLSTMELDMAGQKAATATLIAIFGGHQPKIGDPPL